MAANPSKRATIIEVARRAGVSPATVGRVLGAYGYASDAIQLKVKEAADALGYRPNRIARGLITGRTQTIGVVAGDIESPFYASIVRGVADVARGRGFGVIVTNSDESPQLEREAVQLLLEKQVDGLIVSPAATDDQAYLHAAAANAPMVQIDRVARGLDTDCVVLDNVGSARDSVERLLQAGHRRIGIIAELGNTASADLASFIASAAISDEDLRSLYPSWQRLLGYLQAHRARGLTIDPQLVRRVGIYSAAAAEEETRAVLTASRPASALFTADGVMSTGAMAAISSLGLGIPADLSLICFDDLDWMKFVGTGITAVAQPVHQMGVAAAELLLRRIDGQADAFDHVVLKAELRERNSVLAVHPRAGRSVRAMRSSRGEASGA